MLETDLNKQDQYSRPNNLGIEGSPDSVSDDQLEENVIEIFDQIINDAEAVMAWASWAKPLLFTLSIQKTAR